MKPLLKWPGGKTRVLKHLQPFIPETYNRYYEPFVGGGAFFFHNRFHDAVLSDVNTELVNFYQQVQQNPDELLQLLGSDVFQNTKTCYMQVRSWDQDPGWVEQRTPAERAARFFFLNKTGFNGLQRHNMKGHFNVPYGYYDNPNLTPVELIRNASSVLAEVQLVAGSYQETLSEVGVGDFVYLDPPYVPLTSTSFVKYAKQSFSLQDHEKLAKLTVRMVEEGAHVLMSNSDTPTTRDLYRNLTPVEINVRRSISAASTSRVTAPELILVGTSLL